MNYTTIEQSRKLLELGLSPESADMNWHELPNIGKFVRAFPYVHDNGATEGILPCWSVGALMGVMPLYNGTTPRLSWSKGQCVCFYYCGKAFHNDNIIDACYNMVVWLLENGYIKKGK